MRLLARPFEVLDAQIHFFFVRFRKSSRRASPGIPLSAEMPEAPWEMRGERNPRGSTACRDQRLAAKLNSRSRGLFSFTIFRPGSRIR